MADTSISSDFLGSTPAERLAMCRRLADHAARLAMDADSPEAQRSYLDLKRQWDIIAAELEAELASGEGNRAP